MKKLVIIGCLGLLSSCASKIEKTDLSYKVFPSTSETKYEFNLGIIPTIDGRNSKFVFNHDDYFAKPITVSLSDVLFDEIRASSSFKTVKKLDKQIDFLPNSLQIQSFKDSLGRDALLLTQINNFNVNIRQLSDNDTSNYVSLTMFNNITYKIILVDTESVVFLKTIDQTDSKILKLNSDIHKTINHMAVDGIRKSVTKFKTEFLRNANNFVIANTNKSIPEPIKKPEPATATLTESKPVTEAVIRPANESTVKPEATVETTPEPVAEPTVAEPEIVTETTPESIAEPITAEPKVITEINTIK